MHEHSRGHARQSFHVMALGGSKTWQRERKEGGDGRISGPCEDGKRLLGVKSGGGIETMHGRRSVQQSWTRLTRGILGPGSPGSPGSTARADAHNDPSAKMLRGSSSPARLWRIGVIFTVEKVDKLQRDRSLWKSPLPITVH